MKRGLDAVWFEVHELVAGSSIPSKREFPTLITALTEVQTRLLDDYRDCCAERFGVDEETGDVRYPDPAEEDLVAAVRLVGEAMTLGGLPGVEFRSTRWWVTEEHEETGS